MNLTDLKLGDIIWTLFPTEEDSSITLKHPALVLRNGKVIIIAAMGTSKVDKYQGEFDYEIQDLECTGLSRRTVIRVNKQESLTDVNVLSKAGHLSQRDLENVIELAAYYEYYKR